MLVGKSQGIRLMDVFLLGPFMVWAGARSQLPPWARTFLIGAGVATILYNAWNYQVIDRLESEGR
jgi:hypothetical protein